MVRCIAYLVPDIGIANAISGNNCPFFSTFISFNRSSPLFNSLPQNFFPSKILFLPSKIVFSSSLKSQQEFSFPFLYFLLDLWSRDSKFLPIGFGCTIWIPSSGESQLFSIMSSSPTAGMKNVPYKYFQNSHRYSFCTFSTPSFYFLNFFLSSHVSWFYSMAIS